MHRVLKGQASFDFARVFVEAMEPRLMFDASSALSTAYAYAEANYQSAAISVGFMPSGPTTVSAGQTLTATVSSPFKMDLFCSNAGKTAVVDGTPQATTPSSTESDGVVLPEAGTYVMLSPGTYQVTFYILPEAPTESIGQGVSSDGVTPTFTGNFIIGGAITPNGPGTSPLPFAITNANHIAFINQPRSVGLNAAFSPPLQVAVEDANNNILTADNDTQITLATNDFDTSVFNGSSMVTVSGGVATFSDLTLNSLGTYQLVASTGGITYPMAYPQFNGLVASAASITVNQSGGGGGTAGLTPVITKDTVPAAVIAGSTLHGALKLKLTNVGSTIEHGFFTDIYASPTTTLDTSVDSFVVGMSSRATIKAGKSTSQNITIPRLPSDLSNGDYYLIAQTMDSAGNTNTATSSSFISVQAPVLSLTPVFSAAVKVARNGTATVALTVTNLGNIAPLGTTDIQLFASTSSSLTGATVVLSERMSLPLKPGKSKTIKLKLTQSMVQSIQSQGTLVAEVTDPLGNSQTVFTALSM